MLGIVLYSMSFHIYIYEFIIGAISLTYYAMLVLHHIGIDLYLIRSKYKEHKSIIPLFRDIFSSKSLTQPCNDKEKF